MTSDGPRRVSNKIADYATPEEIETMVVALRKRLRQYEALDDVSGDAKRRSIKGALRAIGKGKVPFAWDERYGATDILAPILTQFDAAFEKFYKEAKQRTQCDDRGRAAGPNVRILCRADQRRRPAWP